MRRFSAIATAATLAVVFGVASVLAGAIDQCVRHAGQPVDCSRRSRRVFGQYRRALRQRAARAKNAPTVSSLSGVDHSHRRPCHMRGDRFIHARQAALRELPGCSRRIRRHSHRERRLRSAVQHGRHPDRNVYRAGGVRPGLRQRRARGQPPCRCDDHLRTHHRLRRLQPWLLEEPQRVAGAVHCEHNPGFRLRAGAVRLGTGECPAGRCA